MSKHKKVLARRRWCVEQALTMADGMPGVERMLLNALREARKAVTPTRTQDSESEQLVRTIRLHLKACREWMKEHNNEAA